MLDRHHHFAGSRDPEPVECECALLWLVPFNVEISGKMLDVDAGSERCAVLKGKGVVEVRHLREDRLLARFTSNPPEVRDALFSPAGSSEV